MTRRKLARKPEQPAESRLRLVESPKPKKRRRRGWKIPRALRGIRRLKYANHAALHAYEEEIVLAALREHGPQSVNSLMQREPERWRPNYLGKTFRRLHKQRRVERLYPAHHRTTRYHLPQEEK